MTEMTYLDTLQLYYEEEVEGEAYFAALAARFDNPHHKHKLTLLAQVEHHAAKAVEPLIARHGISPRSADDLVRSGMKEAQETALDWDALIAEMKTSYPRYLAAFEALEAMGPDEDQQLLSFLTEHEVAAIAFLDLEGPDPNHSAEPLRHYIATPPDTWRVPAA
jgi:hypothetical protein